MEIADLNLIGDFEAGIKCLQNPSLLSKLSLTPKLYTFWTFGALIIAVFATFTNIFIRIKLFLHHIRLKLLSTCQNSRPKQIFHDVDFDFDFSSDDDDTPSSVADSDDEDLDSEDNINNEVFRIDGSCYLANHDDNDEGQNGNFSLRRRTRFSFSDFSAGKSVVQLWDSFGLGLDFEDDDDDDDDSETSLWDGRQLMSENVVLTAEMKRNNDGGVGFCRTYDTRLGGECPAIYAAWHPRDGKIWLKEE